MVDSSEKSFDANDSGEKGSGEKNSGEKNSGENVTLEEVIKQTRVLESGLLQHFCSVAQSSGVPLEDLLVREKVFPPEIFESLKLGVALINDGTITMEKLSVAMFDQMSTNVLMVESLQVRGWLPDD